MMSEIVAADVPARNSPVDSASRMRATMTSLASVFICCWNPRAIVGSSDAAADAARIGREGETSSGESEPVVGVALRCRELDTRPLGRS